MSTHKSVDELEYERVQKVSPETAKIIEDLKKLSVNEPVEKIVQPAVVQIQKETTIETLPTQTSDLPPIVKETVVPVTIREVQPEVTREIEQTEIRRVVVPHTATQVAAPKVIETVAAALEQPTVTVGPTAESVRIAAQIQQEIQPEVVVAEQREIIVEKNPIVHEVVKKKVIEQVQSEIFQKTIAPTIIKETVPIYEKVIIAPQVVYEVRPIITETMIMEPTIIKTSVIEETHVPAARVPLEEERK